MLRRTLFTINFLFVLGLLLSYTAPYIDPGTFWPMAFVGLAYPFLLAVNLGFVLLWAFWKRKRFLWSLVAIVAGWGYLGQLVGLGGGAEPSANDIRIMSYNVKSFDLYNWSKNEDSRDKMIEIIREQDPDVICLQEFFTRDQDKMDNLGRLRKLFEGMGYHFERTITRKKIHHWGLATFTKHPIKEKGSIKFEAKGPTLNGAMYTDISINGKDIRVYNMHLQSIHFATEDYEYIEQIDEQLPQVEPTRKIAGRLKRAFIIRAKQAKQIREHIEQSPYPVVVCGDLNDPPMSFTYRTISSGLTDSFDKAGSGIGQTYKGPFPSYRIDHILLDTTFTVTAYNTVAETYSDHYPVVGVFRFKR